VSRLPAHVARHPHLVGGVECSPAPLTRLDGVAVALVAIALSLLPGCVWHWVARQAPNHVQIETEE